MCLFSSNLSNSGKLHTDDPNFFVCEYVTNASLYDTFVMVIRQNVNIPKYHTSRYNHKFKKIDSMKNLLVLALAVDIESCWQ